MSGRALFPAHVRCALQEPDVRGAEPRHRLRQSRQRSAHKQVRGPICLRACETRRLKQGGCDARRTWRVASPSSSPAASSGSESNPFFSFGVPFACGVGLIGGAWWSALCRVADVCPLSSVLCPLEVWSASCVCCVRYVRRSVI
eukprot:3181845-Rhodomonas_salina.2